jgi:hypothetical protein
MSIFDTLEEFKMIIGLNLPNFWSQGANECAHGSSD